MKKIFLSILAGMALAACAMQNSDKVVGSYYDSDAARYRQNVAPQSAIKRLICAK